MQGQEHYEKYVDMRFNYLDKSIERFEKTATEIKVEVDEIKADNKATRWWVVGTGIAVIFGFATIFFSFVQIQNSWMQTVIGFASKAVLK